MNPESTAWSGVTGIDPFATPLRVVHVCALETAWAAGFVEHRRLPVAPGLERSDIRAGDGAAIVDRGQAFATIVIG